MRISKSHPRLSLGNSYLINFTQPSNLSCIGKFRSVHRPLVLSNVRSRGYWIPCQLEMIINNEMIITDCQLYVEQIKYIIDRLSNITLPKFDSHMPNLEWLFKPSGSCPVTNIALSLGEPISIDNYGKPVYRWMNLVSDWYQNHKSTFGCGGSVSISHDTLKTCSDLIKLSKSLLTVSVPLLLYHTLPSVTNTLAVFINTLPPITDTLNRGHDYRAWGWGPNFRFVRNLVPPHPIIRPPIPMDLRRDVLLLQLQDQIRDILGIIARANLIITRLRNRTPGLNDIEFWITPDGNVTSRDDRLARRVLNSINRSVNEFRNTIGLLRTELALLDFIIWRLGEDVAHNLPQISNIRATIADLVRDPISLYNFWEFFGASVETLCGYMLYFMSYTF